MLIICRSKCKQSLCFSIKQLLIMCWWYSHPEHTETRFIATIESSMFKGLSILASTKQLCTCKFSWICYNSMFKWCIKILSRLDGWEQTIHWEWWLLLKSYSWSHSRRLEGKLFHRIGAVLAKAWSPYVLSCVEETLKRTVEKNQLLEVNWSMVVKTLECQYHNLIISSLRNREPV